MQALQSRIHRFMFLIVLSIRNASCTKPRVAVALQQFLEAKATQWNTSFSVGIYSGHGAWTAVGGLNDRRKHTPMTADLRFPLGSVTKTYTAAAIMQAYEQGLLDIDKPIAQYVDQILYRQNKTTMSELWHGDQRIANITARRLMGMRAGLNDYNDTWYHDITLTQPNHDVGPFELLHRINKTFKHEPGTSYFYASPGYELLGFALAQAYGAEKWQDYDQFSVIPASMQAEYPGTHFFSESGWCSTDPLIVHQYANSPYTFWESVKVTNYTFYDIVNTSCLNGWTFGNIAATPLDIAHFHYDLQQGKIVTQDSLKQMNSLYNQSFAGDDVAYGFGLRPTVQGTRLTA
jgi:D-alanyl-D-alanine carboxypeptidase